MDRVKWMDEVRAGQPGWNWQGQGWKQAARGGYIAAFMFENGDAYVRVPRWLARVVAWVYRCVQ